MHELFERLLEKGEPGIVEMKLVRHQENVELEFKRKSNTTTGEGEADIQMKPGPVHAR